MSRLFAAPIFLGQFKKLLKKRAVVFAPRSRKTRDFMLEYDLSEDDVFEIVSLVDFEHYHEGPEEDQNGTSGNVMIFFYPYKGIKLYIKLKIWTDAMGYKGAIMSVHPEGMHNA